MELFDIKQNHRDYRTSHERRHAIEKLDKDVDDTNLLFVYQWHLNEGGYELYCWIKNDLRTIVGVEECKTHEMPLQ